MANALTSLQLPRPGLFAAFLVLSVISSVLKVDMPLGAGSSCISLSYAVDFTALLVLGPAPDDADCDFQRVVAVHVPDE